LSKWLVSLRRYLRASSFEGRVVVQKRVVVQSRVVVHSRVVVQSWVVVQRHVRPMLRRDKLKRKGKRHKIDYQCCQVSTYILTVFVN
jgi:hypothetical protein